MIFDWLLSLLIVIGALFTLVGSIGLYKLPDFYMRLHGPTKATTLGVGALLISSAIFFSFTSEGISLHEVLISGFLFITAPVSAHLMAKAALHIKVRRVERTRDETSRGSSEKTPDTTRGGR